MLFSEFCTCEAQPSQKAWRSTYFGLKNRVFSCAKMPCPIALWGAGVMKNQLALKDWRIISLPYCLRFGIDSYQTVRATTYQPGPNIVVDEQLFPSKARCRFTQFMASKPDKYGQKFWMAVDNDSKYLINSFPYLGKDDERLEGDRLGDCVMKKLVAPYLN